MRNRFFIALAAVMLPAGVAAQTGSGDTENDFRGRASVSADWKIRKGLHLNGGYELRTADGFARVERNQLSLGLDWSPVKYLELGGGYCFIGGYDSSKEFKPRHRVYIDAQGSYSFGAWKLSLKERLQLTHNNYEFNYYQKTPNFLELKSRLKISYRGFRHVKPYAYAELKNCLNGPSFSADYNETTGKYSNYQFLGYSDTYIERIRGSLGLEWNISRHHALDIRFMADWGTDKDIDTNASGTKLKSWCWQKSFITAACIGYIFSF